MTINEIKELSEKDLQELAFAVNTEMEQRVKRQQKQLWKAVRDAINDYQEKCGPIFLEDSTGEHTERMMLFSIPETPNTAGTLYFC